MIPTLIYQTANIISERLAVLLEAPVAVLDQRAVIIASSVPGVTGFPLEATPLYTHPPALRIPLHQPEMPWQVLIATPNSEDGLTARLVAELVNVVVNQAQGPEILPTPVELRDSFIHDLLHGTPVDESDLQRTGQVLGIYLTGPYAVLLIDVQDYILRPQRPTNGNSPARIRERAETIIRSAVSFFPPAHEPICGYLGAGEVAVLLVHPATSDGAGPRARAGGDGMPLLWGDLTTLKGLAGSLLNRLRYETQGLVRLGLGRYHAGLRGLPAAYREARAAITLGTRLKAGSGAHSLDTLGPAAFVGPSDETTRRDLAEQILHPLDRDPELLQTLTIFFAENCALHTTAERLAVHRNTLGYRFNKVALLTGLDPRRFEDAVQIRLALLVRSL